MSRRHRRECPTATKHSWGDRESAEAALTYIRSTPDSARPKMPVRSYRCECGRWHLTSKR